MTTVDRQGWIGSAARFRFLSDEHISGAKAAFARFNQLGRAGVAAMNSFAEPLRECSRPGRSGGLPLL
jgi:hypothetical protein